MSERYPPEVREKAVRLVLEHLDEYESPDAAAKAIGPRADVHYETLRVWVKKALAEGARPGGQGRADLAAAEREELARLCRGVARRHDHNFGLIAHPERCVLPVIHRS
ncbi:transposase [Nocardia abscessus]|uniref:transposase n=1 Tax=Nocardia abscessus TaxID=120957 RepID=UPI002457DDEA|nr:transposase [Nocardia abscessus]